MPGGRPPLGPKLVESMPGSPGAKARLETILSTIAGRLSIAEACTRLGVGESQFHQLRARALQAAVESLEPKAPGRPAQVPTEAERRAEALDRQLVELRFEVESARLREELIAVMPHLAARPPLGAEKKGGGAEGGTAPSRPDGGDLASRPAPRPADGDDQGGAGGATR